MPYPYRDFRQWVFVFAKFPYMGNSNNAGGCGGNSNYNGEECYVFFKPLGETDWSAAIVCPEKD